MLAVSHLEGRAQARAVIVDAQSGTLSIEDFHRRWQPEPGDPLIDAIFDETEDTIEHVPGSLFRRGSDDGRFRQSTPYKILLVDGQLLGEDFADVPSQRLLEIRTRLLKNVDLGQTMRRSWRLLTSSSRER
jgi:hypothetical protein